MQLTDFFQQTSKIFTVGELTRQIRRALSTVMSSEIETSLTVQPRPNA